MAADSDKQKQLILPYLRRASEIDEVDPKVAYYCRLYAVDQGIHIDKRDPDVEDLLGTVLTTLEKDKPKIDLSQAEDKEHCERFALNVFRRAQRRDEQGLVDRDTAKAYYAAFNFLEILKQFGELGEDAERLRRFSVYRASAIKRALDEGVTPPILGPPPEDQVIDNNTEDQSSSTITSVTPLITNDPGYQEGSKVLCTEDGVSAGIPGTIRTRAVEVGGHFEVEMEDGTLRSLTSKSLAPDLPPGSQVLYYSIDNMQLEGEVIEMDKLTWPPSYKLRFSDRSVVTSRHDQFTIRFVPLVNQRPPPSQGQTWLVRSSSSRKSARSVGRTISETSSIASLATPITMDAKNPAEESGALPPSIEPSASTELPPHTSVIQQDKPYAAYPQNGHAEASPDLPEHSGRENVIVPHPGPILDSMPDQYSPVPVPRENGDHAGTVNVPVMSQPVVSTDPSAVFVRQPGFEPGLQAVEDAKKFAKYANTSLHFNDVDNAIKYLVDALKLLTGPQQ